MCFLASATSSHQDIPYPRPLLDRGPSTFDGAWSLPEARASPSTVPPVAGIERTFGIWHAGAVAGGMRRGGGGIPLVDRVRGTGSAGTADSCPARHCWVSGAADDRGVKRPGLLVEWRRTDAGDWQGRVVYAAELRPGEWALVEEWLPSALLTPR
jgi:hypothetical protein